MPKFSQKSLDRLEQADDRLQLICFEAIKLIDFSVLYSYRTPEEQRRLYAKGRTQPGRKVTNMDGTTKRSYHNYLPSYAVDLAPYPVDWADINRFKELAKVIKGVAAKLQIPVEWGGDWKSLKDYPHFQIPKKNWND